jgi:hypothetical protein
MAKPELKLSPFLLNPEATASTFVNCALDDTDSPNNISLRIKFRN